MRRAPRRPVLATVRRAWSRGWTRWTRTRAGARLTLGVDPDRVYLFDAASGDALAGARLDDAAAAPAPASPS